MSFQTLPQNNIQTEQKVYPQLITPVFENITIKDGLPENSVLAILQDHLGYMWLDTLSALVRYDGYIMAGP